MAPTKTQPGYTCRKSAVDHRQPAPPHRLLLPGRVTGLTAVPNCCQHDTAAAARAPEDTGGWPISHFLIQAKSGRSSAGRSQ